MSITQVQVTAAAKVSPKVVAHAFFTAVDGKIKVFKCNTCGCERKEGNGYANRLSHALTHHQEYQQLEKAQEEAKAKGAAGGMPRYVVISSHHQNVFRWIDSFSAMNIPLYLVGTEMMRGFSRLQPICPNTLLKYMRVLYHGVRNRIKDMLPAKLGIEFDSSKMSPGVSATAMYGLFMNVHTRKPDKALLGFNQLVDNTNATAANYVDTISEVVET